MAGSQIERVFSVLERLTGDPRGLPLQTLAEQLEIPKSATHRPVSYTHLTLPTIYSV